MPDDPDPPRKHYGFKPRDFERANPPRADLPSGPPPPVAASPDSREKIDLHEVIRHATVPGPALRPGARPAAENDVHQILRENAAHATAAGLNALAPKSARRSHRRRDYWLLMVGLNLPLALLGIHALHTGNAVLFIYATAGIGILTAGLSWVMWFVMDDY